MRNKVVPTSPRSSIESKLDDINIILDSCNPFSAMIAVRNLSSDLRIEVDTRKTISSQEYFDYNVRLEKMILDATKTCICHKRSTNKK